MKEPAAKICVLASAVCYGIAEAFAFSHGFSPGPPTLLVFVAGYHLPMAGLAFLVTFGFRQIRMFPAWALMEDVTFFVFNRAATLQKSSWIAMGLGGITIGEAFLPWTYVVLLSIWLVLEFWYARPQTKKGGSQ